MELAYGAASLHIPFPDERIDCVVTSKAADIRPDAAVFGSALLKHLDKGNTAKAFLEVWTR